MASSGGPVVDRRLFPLTSFCIGIWALRRTRKSFLMILPEASKFVLLVTRDNDPKNRGHIGSRIAKHVDHLLRDKNPFVDHCEVPELDTSVLAFEVDWGDVVGVDYKHYLVQDARLVLEAKHCVKHVFSTIEAATAYYGSITAGSDAEAEEMLKQAQPGSPMSVPPCKGVLGVKGSSTGREPSMQLAKRQHTGLCRASTLEPMPPAAQHAPHLAAAPQPQLPKAQGEGSSHKHGTTRTTGPTAAPVPGCRHSGPSMSGTKGTRCSAGQAPQVVHWQQEDRQAGSNALHDSSVAPSTPTALGAAQALLRGALMAAAAMGGSATGGAAKGAFAEAPAEGLAPSSGTDASLGQLAGGGRVATSSDSVAAAPAGAVAAGVSGAADSDSLLPAPSMTTIMRPEQQQQRQHQRRHRRRQEQQQQANAAGLQRPWFSEPGHASPAASFSLAAGSTHGCLSPLLESPWQQDAQGACHLQAAAAPASASCSSSEGGSPAARPACADGPFSSRAMSVGNSPRAPHAAVGHVSTNSMDSSSSSSGDDSNSRAGSRRVSQARSLSLAPIRTRPPSEDHSDAAMSHPATAVTSPTSVTSGTGWATPTAGAHSPAVSPEPSSPMLVLSPGALPAASCCSAPTSPTAPALAAHGFKTHSCFRFRAVPGAATGFASVPCSPVKHGLLGSSPPGAADGISVFSYQHGVGAVHQGALGESGHPQQQLPVIGLLNGLNTHQPHWHHRHQQHHHHHHCQQQHSTLAAAAASRSSSSCPLCQQPLAIADSWQQLQHSQQQAVPQRQSVAGPGLASALQPRSGSACSLQQLCWTDGAAAAAARRLSVDAPGSRSSSVYPASDAAGYAACDSIKLQQMQRMGGRVAGVRRRVAASAPASPRQGQGGASGLQGGVSALQLAAALAEGLAEAGPNAAGATYSCRTLVLTFTDPLLPPLLGKFVKSNMRLLKLYESGLPAWAVFLPSYGLWYRPWLRRITWMLFILVSVLSMVLGFYDLYKNVPYLKQFIMRTFLPASSIFEWFEAHTQIRLSILLTYLFGKSPLLGSLLRFITNTARLTSAALQPLASSISRMLLPLQLALFSGWQQLLWLASPLTTTATVLGQQLLWLASPVTAAASALSQQLLLLGHNVQWVCLVVFGPLGRLLWALGLGLYQLLWLLLAGPLQLLLLLRDALLLPAQYLPALWSGGRSVWSTVTLTGRAAKSAAPVVVNSARVARGGGWLLSAVPLEALGLMRTSAMNLWRAMQAILRFFTAMAITINQHRVSLQLQLRQQGRAVSQRWWATPLGRVLRHVQQRISQQRRRREAEAAAAAGLAAALSDADDDSDDDASVAASTSSYSTGYGGTAAAAVSAAAAAATVAAAAAVAAGVPPGHLQGSFHAASAQVLSPPGSPIAQVMLDGAAHELLGVDMAAPLSPGGGPGLHQRTAAKHEGVANGAAHSTYRGEPLLLEEQVVEPCYCPDCLAAAALQQAAQWQAAGEAVLALGSEAQALHHLKAE